MFEQRVEMCHVKHSHPHNPSTKLESKCLKVRNTNTPWTRRKAWRRLHVANITGCHIVNCLLGAVAKACAILQSPGLDSNCVRHLISNHVKRRSNILQATYQGTTMHCLALRTGAKPRYNTPTPRLLTKPCTLVHLRSSARYTIQATYQVAQPPDTLQCMLISEAESKRQSEA